MRSGILTTFLLFLVLFRSAAQSSTQPSAGPASASSGASQGSATIENQMITYEVLRQMAGQIAQKVSETARPSCTTSTPGKVLLADPSALLEITAYRSFRISSQALQNAYSAGAVGAIGPEAFSDTASAVASLLGAVRNTATYSNQTFQPTAQSMNSLLALALKARGYSLLTVAQPGDTDAAAAKIQGILNDVSRARSAADDKARAKLDPEFTSLRTALASGTPDGTLLATVLKGLALLASLKGQGNEDNDGINFCVLAVSVDAAGGDTRTKHWFLQELVMPTPKPAYNGGAVVSYSLADKAGTLLTGGQLHYMYDFSKWKNPKVPAEIDFSPPKAAP